MATGIIKIIPQTPVQVPNPVIVGSIDIPLPYSYIGYMSEDNFTNPHEDYSSNRSITGYDFTTNMYPFDKDWELFTGFTVVKSYIEDEFGNLTALNQARPSISHRDNSGDHLITFNTFNEKKCLHYQPNELSRIHALDKVKDDTFANWKEILNTTGNQKHSYVLDVVCHYGSQVNFNRIKRIRFYTPNFVGQGVTSYIDSTIKIEVPKDTIYNLEINDLVNPNNILNFKFKNWAGQTLQYYDALNEARLTGSHVGNQLLQQYSSYLMGGAFNKMFVAGKFSNTKLISINGHEIRSGMGFSPRHLYDGAIWINSFGASVNEMIFEFSFGITDSVGGNLLKY